MKLALGTVQFGLPYGVANRSGQVREAMAAAILDYAHLSGMDTIDTAIGYGDSEAVLGRIGVSAFRVITKLPELPEDVGDVGGWVDQQIDGSLERLRTDRIAGVLLHRPDELLGPHGDALASALCRLKDSGRVDKIGVSIYDPDNLERILAVCPIDILQAPFNLVDRRLSHEWLERLKRAGVEIHVRSVFLQGLLLMAPAARPPGFASWDSLWRRWDVWLARNPAIDQATACIGFVQGFYQIDRLVVGVDNLDQLRALVRAAQCTISADFPEIACSDEELINPACWSRQ